MTLLEEPITREMSVMNLGGDTKIKWDSNNAAEVDNARRTYDSLKAQGFTPHVVGPKGNRKASSMDDFDPKAEALIMAPPMVGG